MEKILTFERMGVLVLICIFSKDTYGKLPIKQPGLLFRSKDFWVGTYSNSELNLDAYLKNEQKSVKQVNFSQKTQNSFQNSFRN